MIRGWWQRTHGADFELLRHFLLRFFDSDLITTPGPSPGPFREGVRADELWLLTLTMSIAGLLNAIQWHETPDPAVQGLNLFVAFPSAGGHSPRNL